MTPFARKLAEEVDEVGGTAYLVGGYVRDKLLDLPTKDVDIEVHGVEAETLKCLLSRHTDKIDEVGESFAVWRVGIHDISLPRREVRTGPRHKDFEIVYDPHMGTEEASARRDLTINSMMKNILTGELVDHFGGQKDLDTGWLRPTSDRFKEDPLRVLRAAQFLARFPNFRPSAELISTCCKLRWYHLPKERVFEELKKALLKGRKPSNFFKFLKTIGWMYMFPELEALSGCLQDPLWHPEGDVWTHTMLAIDAAAVRRIGDERKDLIVMLSVLLHDTGKPLTTIVTEDGRIKSPGHAVRSSDECLKFMNRITSETKLIKDVRSLVYNHMAPPEFVRNSAKLGAYRRLAKKCDYNLLLRVSRADLEGVGEGLHDLSTLKNFKEIMDSLGVGDGKLEPILKGRHLLELGFEQGPNVGKIIKELMERQLDGEFSTLEEALEIVKEEYL